MHSPFPSPIPIAPFSTPLSGIREKILKHTRNQHDSLHEQIDPVEEALRDQLTNTRLEILKHQNDAREQHEQLLQQQRENEKQLVLLQRPHTPNSHFQIPSPVSRKDKDPSSQGTPFSVSKLHELLARERALNVSLQVNDLSAF